MTLNLTVSLVVGPTCSAGSNCTD